MLTRTSNDGMGTVEVTDDERRDMAALDVSAAVDVVTAHARARIDMSNRHAPLTAARDLLARAPAMAAELRAARAEIERLRTAAADERADVVAFSRGLAGKAGVRSDYVSRGVSLALDALASSVESGAHVGAAKGGERG